MGVKIASFCYIQEIVKGVYPAESEERILPDIYLPEIS